MQHILSRLKNPRTDTDLYEKEACFFLSPGEFAAHTCVCHILNPSVKRSTLKSLRRSIISRSVYIYALMWCWECQNILLFPRGYSRQSKWSNPIIMSRFRYAVRKNVPKKHPSCSLHQVFWNWVDRPTSICNLHHLCLTRFLVWAGKSHFILPHTEKREIRRKRLLLCQRRPTDRNLALRLATN